MQLLALASDDRMLEDLRTHERGSPSFIDPSMQLVKRRQDVIVSITHLSQFARSRDLRLCSACETQTLDVFLQLTRQFLYYCARARITGQEQNSVEIAATICAYPSAVTAIFLA